MRPSALSAALLAALGFAAGAAPALAQSPVIIEGVDKATREAILELLPDRETPDTLFQAERIAEEAAARANAWLRSEGYYAAKVTPEASETSARLIIAPGARFVFAAPTMTFDGAAPDAVATAAASQALAPVREGEPARAQAVLDAEAAALAALLDAGYADAEAGARRVVVDHASQRVSAEFRFTAGHAVRLGAVRAEPGTLFRESFIERLRNWAPGDAYAPRALTRLRRDLTATGAVSSVSTRLDPPDAQGLSNVVLDVEPARRNAYGLGLGYSTTEGASVEAEWTRRNITRRADSFTLHGVLGEARQTISAELVRPHAAGLGRAVRIGAATERDAPTAYTRTGAALYASVDAASRVRFGRSYGVRLSADSYDDLTGGVDNAVVLSGFADLRHDTTESPLDPRDGGLVDVRLEPAISSGDETLAFARAIVEGRIYESFGQQDWLTLAARVRAGWLEAISGDADNVPPDRRFYAGGGGSVRGYDYNSIYPIQRQNTALAPGGQGLLEGTIEARWRYKSGWGAAVFADAGTAFDDWSEAGDLSWGVGFGVRYDLGFAPLRIDVAFPLDERQTRADYALYISLGQAF